MEGYLIRLPTGAWNVDNDATSTRMRSRRSRRSCKPQARLLYYILGEGYLEGFASPDDLEPVESFQLTSFEVDVDPVYSMLMFKVSTYQKKEVALPSPLVAHGHTSGGDSSDDEDALPGHGGSASSTTPAGSSLLLFAGNKALVELWCKKLVNWNRYVFAGAPSSFEDVDPVEAKKQLITAFYDKNNQGMFSILCQLQDCTAPASPDTVPANAVEQVDRDATITVQQFQPPSLPLPLPIPVNNKAEEEATKPVAKAEIKPLWMLLHRGSSRRIRSVPMSS